MNIDRIQRRCAVCRRRTEQVVQVGQPQGRGPDAYQDIEYRCQVCGRVEKTRRYPNLLADFFSVPAAKPKSRPEHESD